MGSADKANASERRFLMLVLAGGLAIRLIWLAELHGLTAFVGSGEATRVALALARTGSFADAYYPGYGPTAHLLPASPAVAGALFRLLGAGTPSANLAMALWALAQVFCAVLLLRALFRRLGADSATLRWGTALLCLVTPFVSQEMVDFRYWEGATAVCLVCLNLLLLLRLDGDAPPSAGTMLAIAALSAVTFFVSPPAGLAIDACWAIYALRRLSLARCAALALASASALALLLVPWALRNAQAVGEPVLLRSNFGLELALANHPEALSNRSRAEVFVERLLQIHPYLSPTARAELARAGGEVPYARALGRATWRWIGANPAGFARLCLRHLGEFLFPRAWQMHFTDWNQLRAPRATAIGVVNLLGLIGLAFGLRARRRGYGMLAIYIGCVALPYALVQPVPRYTYLVYGVLAFLAVEALVRARRYAAARGDGWAR